MKTCETKSRFNIYDGFYKYGLYMVFVALFVTFSIFNKEFISIANIINLLQQSSAPAIAAVGVVFVLVSGGIDISIGSTIYLTAALVTMATNAGLGLIPAILLVLITGGIIGCLNGFMIAKLHMVPIIVTLAMMFIIRGFTLAITNIEMQYFMNPVGDFIARYRLFGIIPIIVITMIIVLAIGQFVLSYTAFGRHLYAMGNNSVAALKAGIRFKRNSFLVYIISGALAGLAGLVGGAQVGGVTTTYGSGQEFLVISACVLGGVSLFGGKGRIFPGAFLGVLIVMGIENGLVMASANVYLYTIIRGMVIFLAVMVDCLRNTSELR